MHKYYLEFMLNIQNNTSLQILRNSIIEFGENLQIYQLPQDNVDKGKDFRIRIDTEDPTIIFDTCAQFGKLRSIKIEEQGLQ